MANRSRNANTTGTGYTLLVGRRDDVSRNENDGKIWPVSRSVSSGRHQRTLILAALNTWGGGVCDGAGA